ncbi:MAG: hypothetical protein AAF804_12720, partial [Bacteroidota bacterium]
VFWKGCQSCRNYDILTRNERKLCLCTGMLFDPAQKKKQIEVTTATEETALKDRWERYKDHLRRRRGNKILQSIKENLQRRERREKDAKTKASVFSSFQVIRRVKFR